MNKSVNKTMAWKKLALHYRLHKKDEMKEGMNKSLFG